MTISNRVIKRGQRLKSHRGNVNEFSDGHLRGWVLKVDVPTEAVAVGLFVSGRFIAGASANLHRGDLESAGIGDGRCGFAIPVSDRELDLIATSGGIASVRVLDNLQLEVGSYDFRTGSLSPTDPRLPKIRNMLFGEIAHILYLLSTLPDETKAAREPQDPRYNRLFVSAGGNSGFLAEGTQRGASLSGISNYLEFSRRRHKQEQAFDPENDPDDAAHFLSWYLSVYGAQRKGVRIPLSRSELDYLNTPVLIGGQKYRLTRAMLAYLFSASDAPTNIDLNNETSFADVVYRWCWYASRNIGAEDCLVPEYYINLMKSVPIQFKGADFPLSLFMERYFDDGEKLHFLDVKSEKDRFLFTLVLLIIALRRPDVLRFIPEESLRMALSVEQGGESPFGQIVSLLSSVQESGPIDYDTYARLVRLQGYDLYSHRFLSLTKDGHRLEAAALPRPGNRRKVDVQLIGPFSKASGLGQATRLSAEALSRTGLTTNFVDFGMDNPAPEGFSRVGQLADYKRAKVNLIHLNAESIPLALAYQPDVFSDAYNIGYFFWELNTPASCHFLALELLDEVWVSSDYGVEIYEPACNLPVTKVGMCFEDLPDIDRDESRRFVERRFRLDRNNFVFLAAFDSFSFIQRKNPLGVLNAFLQAFQGVEDVRLVIKTQNRTKVLDPFQQRIWNRVDAIVASDPRIILMNETLDYGHLLQLKQGCDCYVSLHRSEGWGFGMIEAMNLKVPVICTGYSGNMEFCNAETAWLVDFEEVPLERDDYIFVRPGQKWAKPDITSAAQQMLSVYTDPAARKKKVGMAHRIVTENFSAEAISKRYSKRLRQII